VPELGDLLRRSLLGELSSFVLRSKRAIRTSAAEHTVSRSRVRPDAKMPTVAAAGALTPSRTVHVSGLTTVG
jgi:hypothetical protein